MQSKTLLLHFVVFGRLLIAKFTDLHTQRNEKLCHIFASIPDSYLLVPSFQEWNEGRGRS